MDHSQFQSRTPARSTIQLPDHGRHWKLIWLLLARADATWADRSSVRNTATKAVSISWWQHTLVTLFDGETSRDIFTTLPWDARKGTKMRVSQIKMRRMTSIHPYVWGSEWVGMLVWFMSYPVSFRPSTKLYSRTSSKLVFLHNTTSPLFFWNWEWQE